MSIFEEAPCDGPQQLPENWTAQRKRSSLGGKRNGPHGVQLERGMPTLLPELTLHPLLYGDIGAVARVHRRACLTAYAFMGWSYTEEECRDWYKRERYPEWDWALVAEIDRAPVAFIAVTGGHLDQLFVDPDHQGRGIGSRLLGEALQRTPMVATLHVFELNIAARRFYERHGFKQGSRFYNKQNQAFELEYERADPG